MFESYLVHLLGRLLGEYVTEGSLSADRFEARLLNGHVVLKRLELKPSCLDGLGLPLRLVRGYIGQLELKIGGGWTQLGSRPVGIVLDNVFLVVEPDYTWGDQEREAQAQAAKQESLARFEVAKLASLDGSSASASGGGAGGEAGGPGGEAAGAPPPLGNSEAEAGGGIGNGKGNENGKGNGKGKGDGNGNGFLDRLMAKIVENIEVNVRTMHVRFEDDGLSHPGHSFAVGVTLESLHVKSTDGRWEPKYVVPGSSRRIHKRLQLNHLAVYCNPTTAIAGMDGRWDDAACTYLTFARYLGALVLKREHGNAGLPTNCYLLRPVDAQLRLEMLRDPLDSDIARDVPALSVEVSVDEVAITVQQAHYCALLHLVERMTTYTGAGAGTEETGQQRPGLQRTGRQCGGGRPNCSVHDAPSLWWRYAIGAVREDAQDRRRRCTAGYLVQRRRDRLKYMLLWKRRNFGQAQLGVDGSSDSVFSEGDGLYQALGKVGIAELALLERKLEYDDIVFFRSLAEKELREERADMEIARREHTLRQEQQGWFAWMVGYAVQDSTAEGDPLLTEAERTKLSDMLDYNPVDHLPPPHGHADAVAAASNGDTRSSHPDGRAEALARPQATVQFHLERGSITLLRETAATAGSTRWDRHSDGESDAESKGGAVRGLGQVFPIVEARFDDFLVALHHGPTSIKIDGSLRSFSIFDQCPVLTEGGDFATAADEPSDPERKQRGSSEDQFMPRSKHNLVPIALPKGSGIIRVRNASLAADSADGTAWTAETANDDESGNAGGSIESELAVEDHPPLFEASLVLPHIGCTENRGSVDVRMEPLVIVYRPRHFDRIVEFFAAPFGRTEGNETAHAASPHPEPDADDAEKEGYHAEPSVEPSATVRDKLDGLLTALTDREVDDLLSHHVAMDVNISIKAPVIIIPSEPSDRFDPNSTRHPGRSFGHTGRSGDVGDVAVVIDLGHVTISSSPANTGRNRTGAAGAGAHDEGELEGECKEVKDPVETKHTREVKSGRHRGDDKAPPNVVPDNIGHTRAAEPFYDNYTISLRDMQIAILRREKCTWGTPDGVVDPLRHPSSSFGDSNGTDATASTALDGSFLWVTDDGATVAVGAMPNGESVSASTSSQDRDETHGMDSPTAASVMEMEHTSWAMQVVRATFEPVSRQQESSARNTSRTAHSTRRSSLDGNMMMRACAPWVVSSSDAHGARSPSGTITSEWLWARVRKEQIVERFNINVDLHNCILPTDPTLTQLKLSGSLDELRLRVSALAIRDVVALYGRYMEDPVSSYEREAAGPDAGINTSTAASLVSPFLGSRMPWSNSPLRTGSNGGGGGGGIAPWLSPPPRRLTFVRGGGGADYSHGGGSSAPPHDAEGLHGSHKTSDGPPLQPPRCDGGWFSSPSRRYSPDGMTAPRPSSTRQPVALSQRTLIQCRFEVTCVSVVLTSNTPEVPSEGSKESEGSGSASMREVKEVAELRLEELGAKYILQGNTCSRGKVTLRDLTLEDLQARRQRRRSKATNSAPRARTFETESGASRSNSADRDRCYIATSRPVEQQPGAASDQDEYTRRTGAGESKVNMRRGDNPPSSRTVPLIYVEFAEYPEGDSGVGGKEGKEGQDSNCGRRETGNGDVPLENERSEQACGVFTEDGVRVDADLALSFNTLHFNVDQTTLVDAMLSFWGPLNSSSTPSAERDGSGRQVPSSEQREFSSGNLGHTRQARRRSQSFASPRHSVLGGGTGGGSGGEGRSEAKSQRRDGISNRSDRRRIVKVLPQRHTVPLRVRAELEAVVVNFFDDEHLVTRVALTRSVAELCQHAYLERRRLQRGITSSSSPARVPLPSASVWAMVDTAISVEGSLGNLTITDRGYEPLKPPGGTSGAVPGGSSSGSYTFTDCTRDVFGLRDPCVDSSVLFRVATGAEARKDRFHEADQHHMSNDAGWYQRGVLRAERVPSTGSLPSGSPRTGVSFRGGMTSPTESSCDTSAAKVDAAEAGSTSRRLRPKTGNTPDAAFLGLHIHAVR